MDKKKLGKALLAAGAVLGTSFVVLNAVAKKKKPDSVYDNEPGQKNPLEGKKVVFVEDENDKGHL